MGDGFKVVITIHHSQPLILMNINVNIQIGGFIFKNRQANKKKIGHRDYRTGYPRST